MSELRDYYSRIAPEYDKEALNDGRLDDVAFIEEVCRENFSGQKVLDAACGTGQWTHRIGGVADRVAAFDINHSMLARARAKNSDRGNVDFLRADIFSPPFSRGTFQGAFSGWWFSHVERQFLPQFIKLMARTVKIGSPVIFTDDTPSVDEHYLRSDDAGNTIVQRRTVDGTGFEIIKNLYTHSDLRALFSEFEGTDIWSGNYHWCVRYHRPTEYQESDE